MEAIAAPLWVAAIGFTIRFLAGLTVEVGLCLLALRRGADFELRIGHLSTAYFKLVHSTGSQSAAEDGARGSQRLLAESCG